VKIRWNWQTFGLVVLGCGLGALAPSIATLAAQDAVSMYVSRYAEMISSVAILGLLTGVALVAVAIPHVVAGERR
jgi:hypothetical protein